MCESHLRWGTSFPNLGTLGLRVLELFAIYATDGRTKTTLIPLSLPSGSRGHNSPKSILPKGSRMTPPPGFQTKLGRRVVLTFDLMTVSSLCSVNHLCRLAPKSVHAFSECCGDKIGNGRTDRYNSTSNNSKIVQDRATLIMADQQKVAYRTASFSMTLNNPNPVFKVTSLFNAKYLRNGRHYDIQVWLPGAVPRGGQGAAPSEISGPPLAPHLRKFSAKVIKLRIAKQRCLFNAIMFCDILMIYITY